MKLIIKVVPQVVKSLLNQLGDDEINFTYNHKDYMFNILNVVRTISIDGITSVVVRKFDGQVSNIRFDNQNLKHIEHGD